MVTSRHNSAHMCLLIKLIAAARADPLNCIVAAIVILACLSAMLEFLAWIGGV